MTILKSISLAVLLILCSTSASSQSVQTTTTTAATSSARDANALGIISKSLVNFGLTAIKSPSADNIVQASCSRQSQDTSRAVRWIKKGEFTRYDAGSDGKTWLVDGPSGAYRVTPKGSFPLEGRTTYMFQPFYLPGLLLWNALTDTRFSVLTDSPASQSGPIHIRISDNGQTNFADLATTDWFFSRDTQMLTEVRYSMPTDRDSRHVLDVVLRYSNPGVIGTVVSPRTLTQTIAGVQASVCTLLSVESSISVDDSVFTIEGAK